MPQISRISIIKTGFLWTWKETVQAKLIFVVFNTLYVQFIFFQPTDRLYIHFVVLDYSGYCTCTFCLYLCLSLPFSFCRLISSTTLSLYKRSGSVGGSFSGGRRLGAGRTPASVSGANSSRGLSRLWKWTFAGEGFIGFGGVRLSELMSKSKSGC